MATHVHITGDSELRIWGLYGRERLQRMLAAMAGVELVEDTATLPASTPVLYLRGDHVYDARVLSALITTGPGSVLVLDNGEPVAASTTAGRAGEARKLLADGSDGQAGCSDLRRLQLGDLALEYQVSLSKNDPGYVLPVTRDKRDLIEAELFAGSYKGVTDLVTKWLWPAPARYATRLCVRLGLSPNQVTMMSLVLAIFTALAFWQGELATGLVMAWVMTFLDTVDGKLARVTVTSSRIGDILDHGLDLVHPPIWYLAWGVGTLGGATPVTGLGAWIWVLFLAYLGGRACEGLFTYWAASFPMFIWRPFDSYNRLITARRNPNLILLTLSLLVSRPDLGLYAVVVWHVISTLLLGLRLVIGITRRRHSGTLRSWLNEVDPLRDRRRLAVRMFTRVPAGRSAD